MYTRWWFQRSFVLTPTWGNDPIWRAYFSDGLVQLPTSIYIYMIIYVYTAHWFGWSDTLQEGENISHQTGKVKKTPTQKSAKKEGILISSQEKVVCCEDFLCMKYEVVDIQRTYLWRLLRCLGPYSRDLTSWHFNNSLEQLNNSGQQLSLTTCGTWPLAITSTNV